MIRNYFLLNLLLILIIGMLGNKFYHVLKYSAEIPAEAGTGEVRKEEINVEHKDKAVDEGAFEVISALDPFRPSRSAPLIQNKGAEKPPLPPPPKLFGTVILNDNKTAILEQPDTKTTKIYRINDTISGYKVLEIHEDKVVLLGNDEKVEVRLRDDKGIQPQRGAVVRPAFTPPSARQTGNTGAVPQRRARPVPPRRRPTITPPPVNTNLAPPEIPQAPEVPEAPDAGNDPAQEEAQ
jgi:type II secretory pathway component PulC